MRHVRSLVGQRRVSKFKVTERHFTAESESKIWKISSGIVLLKPANWKLEISLEVFLSATSSKNLDLCKLLF